MPQRQADERHELSAALYEELVALKLRIAFAELSEDEFAEFEEALASLSDLDYSEDAQRRTLKEIERRLNRRDKKRFVHKTLPHAINVVAAMFLLFFVALTTATATVRPVRLKVLEFIALIEDHYSAVSLDYNDNDAAVVPAEWKGAYYPSYIPLGFELSFVDELYNTVYYKADGSRAMDFSEYNDSVYLNIDITEEGTTEVLINESTGIAKENEDGVAITWNIDDTYFYLYFSGDLDEALFIAESVRPIRQQLY